jgi:Rieske Fe-S protein
MQNTPPHSCCCARHAPLNDDNRRGFLQKVTALVFGGGAFLTPVVVGVVSFLNPLRQKSQSGQFMRLASLDALPEGVPQKVSVLADRSDAWNIYPAEPIGAVYLRRHGSTVAALQVICPHAGCSIGFESAPNGGKFFCPCHSANFDLTGKRTDVTSPTPRDMDTLEVDIRNNNEVWVKFQTFGLGTAKKVALG